MIVNGKRSLAHVEKVSWIESIEGNDDFELIGVLGWKCISESGTFSEGDLCVYIEIDSKVPKKEWSEFLYHHDYEVKTTHFKDLNVISQGIALPLNVFDVEIPNDEGEDVTELLKIAPYNLEDFTLQSDLPNEYDLENQRREEMIGDSGDWLMNSGWGKKSMSYLFGEEKDPNQGFPTRFPHISKTNLEFIENIPDILKDKTPFIRAQKCDGLSATYILEKIKKSFGKPVFEFYVCSQNYRLFKRDEDSSDNMENYYWEMAEKYDIEDKLKFYLENNDDCEYVCWQGEICGPDINGNPQKLTENHLFCFQMIDSVFGRFDIRNAKHIWFEYDMECVPIESMTYILPDDFEEFKRTADGYYSKNVCEGQTGCTREGWTYYKTTDPSFSFKNTSINYLIDKNI